MNQNRLGFEVDDDGCRRRTGTVWTAIAHVFTAAIGSGVLSLAWATAQLGWIAGPAVMFMFSFITLYTSALLADCYRTGDTVGGERNITYKRAVRAILGREKAKLCGLVQYLHHFGVPIIYTTAASISMMSARVSACRGEAARISAAKPSINTPLESRIIPATELSSSPSFHEQSTFSLKLGLFGAVQCSVVAVLLEVG